MIVTIILETPSSHHELLESAVDITGADDLARPPGGAATVPIKSGGKRLLKDLTQEERDLVCARGTQASVLARQELGRKPFSKESTHFLEEFFQEVTSHPSKEDVAALCVKLMV